MAASGAVLARCHALLARKAREGVTTDDLDEAAERFIRSQGAEPTFKGYRGFPGSICASPNSMVVHGIPGSYALQRGDVLCVDIGVTLDGWVSDAAVTLPIGPISPVATSLLATTRASLFEGLEQCRPGNRLGDVSNAIQRRVEADRFSVIRSLVGHGVGRDMHEDPQIPNFGEPRHRPRAGRGHGAGHRADGQRRRPRDPHGQRQLGRLLARRLAGGPFRAHGRHHRRRAPDTHPLAPQDGDSAGPAARARRKRMATAPAADLPLLVSTVGALPIPGRFAVPLDK